MKTPLKVAAARMAASFAFSVASLAAHAEVRSAETLADVTRIYIKSAECIEAVGTAINQLFEDGAVQWRMKKDDADAMMVLSVTELGQEITPSNTSIGGRLSPVSVYQAMIPGAGKQALFETSGKINSVNREEMCADIAQDIARQLQAEKG